MSDIRYADALAILNEVASRRAARLGSEEIPLEKAVGRVGSEEVRSVERLPAFANSAMDGFAVRARECSEANTVLEVADFIAAGDVKEAAVPGTASCVEIMTGARVPAGFDSIVRIEDTAPHEGGGRSRFIRLLKAMEAGENLRDAGEDYEIGDRIIARGERVQAAHIMALAALGAETFHVLPKIKVGLISTGKELVPHSVRPSDAQIRNSTLPYLISRLEGLGASVVRLGTVPDDADQYGRLLENSRISGFDVILSTGAVSVGKRDFVADVLKRVDAKIHFHRVAIRPGKPLLFAEIPGGPAFFGVPGNPVSTSVGLRFFIEPFLRTLQSLRPEQKMRLRLKNDFKKPEGLRCFFKAHLSPSREAPSEVEILDGQASFMIKPLTRASLWAILDEEGKSVRAGELIDAVPLDHSFEEVNGD